MKVIVDTNIVLSSLLKKDNIFRNTLLFRDDLRFYSCRLLLIELFEHKEKLIKFTKLQEEELLEVLYDIFKLIDFYNELFISEDNLKKAYDLCAGVDLKDLVFVALTLELEGFLWTGDKKLTDKLKEKGFNRFFRPDAQSFS